MKKLLPYLGLAALTFSIGFVAFDALDGSGSRSENKGVPTDFKAAPAQPRPYYTSDEPLLIEQVNVTPLDAHSSAVSFKVRNVSDSPVRMYVLRYVFAGKEPLTGTVRNTPFQLAPGGSQLDGFSCGFIVGPAPAALKITVEYVEFTDGRRWGVATDDTRLSATAPD
jgi:hypothetical protein